MNLIMVITSSKLELDRWVKYIILSVGGSEPDDIYIKGRMENFNGIAFLKFHSRDIVQCMAEKIRKTEISYNGEKYGLLWIRN